MPHLTEPPVGPPYPVAEGAVDEDEPKGNEEEVGGELDAVGRLASDMRAGDR